MRLFDVKKLVRRQQHMAEAAPGRKLRVFIGKPLIQEFAELVKQAPRSGLC